MSRERDLFANFERMRREMDALFGDVVDRPLTPRRGGFSPRVDVFYAPDPPRAVVHAELAGIAMEQLSITVEGRRLVVAGHRKGPLGGESAGRVYQQLEIEHGPFRRTIELGAEVVADHATASYDDGILRIELPLAQPEHRSHQVPIRRGDTETPG